MERISKFQLGAMIILFQIGSTPLFQLGIRPAEAGSAIKQDAWLTVIASMLLGLLLLLLLLAIQRREPEKNLNQLLIQYFGSFAGKLVVLFYALTFIYESMRNVRDFGDLTLLTILPRTPISVVMLILLILSVYAIHKGMEVFFRVAEFIVWGVLLFYIALIVMSFASGIVRLDRLLPMLENGVRPVLQESLYSFFPFNQMTVFLIFWSYLNEKKGMSKASIRAFFVSGAVILITNVINLAVLGAGYTGISTIPLLETVRLIQIADVFERFDALVILLFYAGIFIKTTLWLLAGLLGLSQLFQTDYRRFVLPVGAIIYSTAFLPPSWQAHLKVATIVADQFKLNHIYSVFIPVLLFIVMRIKGHKNG